MKSLQESLFDKDLAKKDTGLEYLYNLVIKAHVFCYQRIHYIDEEKIIHEFNQIIKKFPQKKWTENEFLRMDKICRNNNEELFRKLLYLIVCNIKTGDVLKSNNDIDTVKLQRIITQQLKNFILTDEISKILVLAHSTPDRNQIDTEIKFYLGHTKYNLASISFTLNNALL